MFSDQATDAWQKIDNTAVGNVSGSGTIERLAKWSGSGTIANSTISDDGSTVTFNSDVVFNSTHDVMWDASENRLEFWDNAKLTFGDPGGTPDLVLYHDGSNSYINDEGTGNLLFQSGGSTRFSIGGDVGVIGSTDFFIPQGRKLLLDGVGGHTYIEEESDSNLKFYVAGSERLNITNTSATFVGDVTVGDELTITTIGNATADPDKFLCASGANKVGYRTGAQVLSDIGAASSGSLASYLPLAGGTMTGDLQLQDNVRIDIGNSSDLQLWHNGTNSYVFNYNTGALNIGNSVTDGNTNFLGDDGSGGEETYFRVDGGNEDIDFLKSPHVLDSVTLKIGSASGGDLQIYHNGSHSLISNQTGHLYIRNQTNDGDISFQADDGSGGDTEYIRIDGGAENINILKNTVHPDSVYTYWGDSNDFYIGHTSTSTVMLNSTGNLEIANYANDKDILLRSDDGSGGIATYLALDGSLGYMVASKQILFNDNVMARFGNSGDMEIFHDGSHSRIKDVGSGHLTINATDFVVNNSADTKNMIIATDGGSVNLYYNASQKFRTISNGVEVTGKTDTDSLLIGSSTEVDAILDEDNMASNSATSLATQQSIKAYVDAISVPTVNNSTINLSAGTGLNR